MTDEQFQILAAAVLETASRIESIKFVGNVDRLADVVQNDWDGNFTRDDVLAAIETLRKFGLVEQSSTSRFISISHPIVIRKIKSGSGLNFNARRVAPLLVEYAEFGEDWLNAMWNQHMQERAADGAFNPQIQDQAAEIEAALQQIIPASDREVTPSHNLPDYIEALEKVRGARQLIEQSNQLSEAEKADTLLHLDAGIGILSKARRYAVGTIRYLILDRLKAAFEGVIEDAFKAAIIVAFMTLASLLLWMVGN